MIRRLLTVTALLLALAACSKPGLQDLKPGKSTRAEVERALGKPLRTISDTLAEHAGMGGEKILIQYGDIPDTLERIERLYPAGQERSALLAALKLDSASDRQQHNSLGRLEEHYLAAGVVLTHRGADAGSSIDRVSYYRPEQLAARPVPRPRKLAAALPPETPPAVEEPPQPLTQQRIEGGPGPGALGCYKDTSDFDLDGHLERSAQNTPQRCIALCREKGYAYAGVQYGESCMCGNRYGRYGETLPAACNYPCTGDPAQTCGGYSTNAVYPTG